MDIYKIATVLAGVAAAFILMDRFMPASKA